MSATSSGLHHVTAIAGRAQANIEFYVRFMGLRLVKRTVNFEDPKTYHLYFGDALGNPGSIITFFPWPGAGPAVRGQSEAVAIALRVPVGSLGMWQERLDDHRLAYSTAQRFGRALIAFSDPDGTPLELVEGEQAPASPAPRAGADLSEILTPTRYWTGSSVPAHAAITGIDSVTLSTANPDATAELLADVIGWQPDATTAAEQGRTRLVPTGLDPAVATAVDLVKVGPEGSGRLGTGSVHHLAFRLADDDALERGRERLRRAGVVATKPKDRLYFRSVYFRDPAGAILELATDSPGFTVDEPADELGLAFKLPEWLEPDREHLRAQLPVTASPEYADRFR